MAAPLPNFSANAQQAAGPQGWQGLQGLMSLLQGGLNQSQFSNLQSGYTGGNGYAVGGAHGAFSGLSPWAVNFLSNQQGLFTKTPTMATQSLTGADGQALTGSQLLMAQIHNGLAANSPSQYKLADGITADNLASMLSDYASSSGHSAYAKGDNATGRAPFIVHGDMQGTPGSTMQQHPWNAGEAAHRHIYGRGLNDKPFYNKEAWNQSKARQQQGKNPVHKSPVRGPVRERPLSR